MFIIMTIHWFQTASNYVRNGAEYCVCQTIVDRQMYHNRMLKELVSFDKTPIGHQTIAYRNKSPQTFSNLRSVRLSYEISCNTIY